MIFLYNFEIKSNGIDFVLNEEIAKDMYADLEVHLRSIVESTSHLLINYKYLSKSNIIMNAKILDTDELEILFSEGLGKYINPYEKNLIFDNGKIIADILVEVMHRRFR